MALNDDPKEWILRLFEMEENEGRGADCQRLPNGERPTGVPLEPWEKVYGIYKRKYFFTPQSFVTKEARGFQRLRWEEIASCSSRHGEGKKSAELTLTDGSVITVRVGDFGTGWSGRISQLFHQMIEKWGAQATLGPQPLSIEDFFAAASDEYCLAPNLMPHPSLQEMEQALIQLRNRESVFDVLLRIVEVEGDGTPISDAVIVRMAGTDSAPAEFAARFGADGVIEAPEGVIPGLPMSEGQKTKLIVWD